jgi:hypothetical protein
MFPVQSVEVPVEQVIQMQTSLASADQVSDSRTTRKSVLGLAPTVVILQQRWDQAMQAAVSKFSQNSR